MGTTSQKLTYLSGTKDKLKTAINYTGANITNDTFRSYPEKLYNEYIDIINNGTGTLYSNMPKVNGQGDSLTLNDTEEAPMLLSLYGETQQDSTTGKNKLDKNKFVEGSCTFGNVGVVPSYSSASTNRFTMKPDNAIEVEPNTTYTFNMSYSGDFALAQLTSETISLGDTGWKTSSDLPFTITTEATTKYIAFNIKKDSSTSMDTIKSYNYQIELGNQATSYEPYTNGASPNPDYPQPIHNVSGDNTIEICGENLLNNSTMTAKTSCTITNEEITSSALGQYTLFEINTNNIKLEKNTDYYVTFKAKLDSGTGTLNYGGLLYDGTNNTSQASVTKPTISSSYQLFCWKISTTLDNFVGKIMRFQLGGASNAVISVKDIIVSKTQNDTYEAYTGDSQLISLGVENLFDKDNANLLTAFFSQESIISTTSNEVKTLYITCKPNTTYTISKVASTRFRVMTTTNTPAVGVSGNGYTANDSGTKITITTGANANYLCVFYYNGSSDTKTEEEIRNSIQIEKGSKANSYSPYGASYIELCKIDTYQDYIYKSNNIWYLHKEIGKVVLNGSENWFSQTQQSFYRYGLKIGNMINKSSLSDTIISFANYFKSITFNNRHTQLQETTYLLCNNNTDGEFYINTLTFTTLENFKTWLSTHNTDVYYVLDTPTDTEITDTTLLEQLNNLEQIKSKKNQTNINQENNDLPFIITASAIKEYE